MVGLPPLGMGRASSTWEDIGWTYDRHASCRWEVVESGAGAPFLFGAELPHHMTGPQVQESWQGLGWGLLLRWYLLHRRLESRPGHSCLQGGSTRSVSSYTPQQLKIMLSKS